MTIGPRSNRPESSSETARRQFACPEDPPQWKRQFPVFGAVSALAASIAAVEGIKVLSGLGEPLAGTLLHYDTLTMSFQRVAIERRADCAVCGKL